MHLAECTLTTVDGWRRPLRDVLGGTCCEGFVWLWCSNGGCYVFSDPTRSLLDWISTRSATDRTQRKPFRQALVIRLRRAANKRCTRQSLQHNSRLIAFCLSASCVGKFVGKRIARLSRRNNWSLSLVKKRANQQAQWDACRTTTRNAMQ